MNASAAGWVLGEPDRTRLQIPIGDSHKLAEVGSGSCRPRSR
jgi:hypothetical protein